MPAAGLAGFRLRARRRAAAFAGAAGHGLGHMDGLILAVEGFFQSDFEVIAQVSPALRSAAPAASGKAARAEYLAEQVLKMSSGLPPAPNGLPPAPPFSKAPWP